MLKVDGAAKTPGTVTVKVTTSVDVDVSCDEVDVPTVVKVWKVVGSAAAEVVTEEIDNGIVAKTRGEELLNIAVLLDVMEILAVTNEVSVAVTVDVELPFENNEVVVRVTRVVEDVDGGVVTLRDVVEVVGRDASVALIVSDTLRLLEEDEMAAADDVEVDV